MTKGTLRGLILAPFDERDLLPQVIPELGVVCIHVQAVVVHRQIKGGEEQLAEVKESDVDVATMNQVSGVCMGQKA